MRVYVCVSVWHACVHWSSLRWQQKWETSPCTHQCPKLHRYTNIPKYVTPLHRFVINRNWRAANFRLERGHRTAQPLRHWSRRTADVHQLRNQDKGQTEKLNPAWRGLLEQPKVTVRKCRFSINFPSRTITLMDLQCLWMIKHDYFQRSGDVLNSSLLCGNKWLIGVYLLRRILSYNVINQAPFYPVVCSQPYLTSFHFLALALHVSCAPCACFITDET